MSSRNTHLTATEEQTMYLFMVVMVVLESTSLRIHLPTPEHTHTKRINTCLQIHKHLLPSPAHWWYNNRYYSHYAYITLVHNINGWIWPNNTYMGPVQQEQTCTQGHQGRASGWIIGGPPQTPRPQTTAAQYQNHYAKDRPPVRERSLEKRGLKY